MKKIFSLIATLALLSGCSYFEKKEEGAGGGAKGAGGMPPLQVAVFKAQKSDVPIALKFNGETASDLDVTLKSQVSGTIEKQLFTPGVRVEKGEGLYEIDKSRYQAIFNSAKASLNNASADYERARKLKASNTISAREFDGAKSAYEVAKANFESAKIDLDNALVKAPFDGIVGDTQKDTGSFVGVGENLVRLTKLNPIYVKFGISDTDKMKIDRNLASSDWYMKNTKATISLNDKIYEGNVVFIDSVVDSATASVSAKAQFNNLNYEIQPGIYTRISVDGFVQKDGFQIPQIAVLQDLSNSIVYVVDANNTVAKKIVKVIAQDSTTMTISEGLSEGDLIVLDNFSKIQVGAKVTPLPPETDATKAR